MANDPEINTGERQCSLRKTMHICAKIGNVDITRCTKNINRTTSTREKEGMKDRVDICLISTHHPHPVRVDTATSRGATRGRSLGGIEAIRWTSKRRAIGTAGARHARHTRREWRTGPVRKPAGSVVRGEGWHTWGYSLSSGLTLEKDELTWRESTRTHTWRTHPRRHNTVRRERGRTWRPHHARRTLHTRGHGWTT